MIATKLEVREQRHFPHQYPYLGQAKLKREVDWGFSKFIVLFSDQSTGTVVHVHKDSKKERYPVGYYSTEWDEYNDFESLKEGSVIVLRNVI